jgi:hypothetical protein
MRNWQRSAFEVFNIFSPKRGGKSIPYIFDFTAVSEISDDMILEEEQGVIEFISGIYVDNRSNGNTTNDFVITFVGTGQTVSVPPGCQGMFPVIAVRGAKFVATCNSAVKVVVQFLNFPTPLTQWGPLTVTVSNVTANFSPTRGTFTDRSGSITLGNTAQTLAAVNANRNRIMIVNPATAASQGIATSESLFINFTSAAVVNGVGSIELTPGGSFDNAAGPVSTELISVIAATTGHCFTAKEM